MHNKKQEQQYYVDFKTMALHNATTLHKKFHHIEGDQESWNMEIFRTNVLSCNNQGVQTIILTTNLHTNQNTSIKFNQETCSQFFASIQSNVNTLPINNVDDEGPMKNTNKSKKKITKISFDGSIEVHSRKPR